MTNAAITKLAWPALFTLLLLGCAAQPIHDDDRLVRAELLAMLQSLNADLLSHDSATLTLERWCGDHRLADPARVVARRVQGTAKPIPEPLREKLAVDAAEPIGYRHVQLVCGTHVLSEADNWYVPGRLTVAMNQQLDTTDEPFGKVVRPLGFQRRTLSAELLWSPLPPGWESAGAAPAAANRTALHIPPAVLRHQAILYSAAQQPFSAVVETYTSATLGFGRWAEFLEPE